MPHMGPEEAVCHGLIPSKADGTYSLVESHGIDLYDMTVSYGAHIYRIESPGKESRLDSSRSLYGIGLGRADKSDYVKEVWKYREGEIYESLRLVCSYFTIL